MPPGKLSSANRLRQANATAAGLYRLSNRAFAGAVGKQPARAFLRSGDAGGVAASPILATGESRQSMGTAPIAVRHGLIGIDGGRPHGRAARSGRKMTRPAAFLGRPPPRMVHTPAHYARSRAPLHPRRRQLRGD